MKRSVTMLLLAALGGVLSCLAASTAAQASMIGTWQGRWYYSPTVVWKVPPPQSSYQMDLVITADVTNPDGTESLAGYMDFYFPDNVLSQGPSPLVSGTKNGFSLQFIDVAHYDYQASLNFTGDEMLGTWYPSVFNPPSGVPSGCTPQNVQDAYCGGFDLRFQPARVPEPAGLGTLGLGLAGLVVRRRR